jgi:hypothetical protein
MMFVLANSGFRFSTVILLQILHTGLWYIFYMKLTWRVNCATDKGKGTVTRSVSPSPNLLAWLPLGKVYR